MQQLGARMLVPAGVMRRRIVVGVADERTRGLLERTQPGDVGGMSHLRQNMTVRR